jgi:beta-lactamase superfamily II metal-dependent hydrolase
MPGYYPRVIVRFVFAFVGMLLSPVAFADVVVPTADVITAVVVRQTASTQSRKIGSLRPGQQAELLGSVPNWHRVQLAGGVTGFVSKRWTRVIPSAPPATARVYTMDVVDVGTGLGVLVRGPDFTLVYDGGSNDDLARGQGNRMLAYIKAVVPTLTTIDQLILSHPHRDHVELLPDLFAAYHVGQVWDSGRVNDICGYRAFLTAVRDDAGVQYHNALQDFGTQSFSFKATACYGQTLPAEVIQLALSSRISEAPITLGQNASMTILHADGAPFPSPNDNSLVVRLNLGDTRILLMGDAEAGGRQVPSVVPTPASIEGQLLACCTADLAARIMVVGHHGSKTSSRRALLDAVGASVFIVSSGPMKYGSVTLPDAEVISELASRGQVFRTDQNDGACAQNTAKVGPDADGKAGGCDNIRVVVTESGPVQVSVWNGHD